MIESDRCRCGHARSVHKKLTWKRRRQSCMSSQYCECGSFKARASRKEKKR